MNRFIRKNILPFLLLSFIIAGCSSPNNQVQNPSDDATIKRIHFVANDSSPYASSASFRIDNEEIENMGQIYNEDSLPYGTRIDSLYLQITFGSSLGFNVNDSISESNYLSTVTTRNHYDFTKPFTIENVATDGNAKKKYKMEVRVHKVETYLHTWTKLTSAITAVPAENQKAILLKDNLLYFQNNGAATRLFTSASDYTVWTAAPAVQGLPDNPKLRNMLVFKDKIYLFHNGSELYNSDDGITWKQIAFNADSEYNYTSLLFGFKDWIWGVAQHKTDNSVRVVLSKDNGLTWTFGGKRAFYDDFPVTDFAAANFAPQIGPDKVVVAGGISASGKRLNTIWSAENILKNDGQTEETDTLKWATLNKHGKYLNEVSMASIQSYGNKLLMFSGVSNTLDIDTIQLRHSTNEGMNWVIPDTLVNRPPEDYIHRSGTSLVHDTKNRTLYVIGGKSETSPLADVWRIKVNFYSFDDYDPNNSKY